MINLGSERSRARSSRDTTPSSTIFTRVSSYVCYLSSDLFQLFSSPLSAGMIGCLVATYVFNCGPCKLEDFGACGPGKPTEPGAMSRLLCVEGCERLMAVGAGNDRRPEFAMMQDDCARGLSDAPHAKERNSPSSYRHFSMARSDSLSPSNSPSPGYLSLSFAPTPPFPSSFPSRRAAFAFCFCFPLRHHVPLSWFVAQVYPIPQEA